jgi:glycosyltransferase involved in cell wall biosynthesis
MPASGLHVISVGRLVPEKGLGTLLRAWRHVVEKVPEAHLHIVGAGPLRGALEAESCRLEIEPNVTFHGEQSDVIPYLRAADCFVLPSTVEGMSNALLEAMATGLPIVASRIGGTESLLEDRITGLLVAPDDSDDLVRGLTTVLEHPDRSAALGRQARAQMERAYGIDRVADVYMDFYGSPASARPDSADGEGRASSARPSPTIGYLLSLFPCWSETFILREILALRERGVPVRIFSLRLPSETLVQEAARDLLDEVIYPPAPWRLALGQLAWVARRPIPWLTAMGHALLEARQGGACEVAKALYTVAVAAHFCRIARRQGIDHVHAHWATYPALGARVMRALSGVPYTITAHAHDIFLPNPYLKRNIADAYRTVTISDYNRRHLLSIGAAADALTIVPCGLDLRDFAPVQRRRNDPPLIVAVGRLEPIKGFPYLLEACALLRRRGLDFVCQIVGDGSLRRELEQKIHVLGLGERVRLLGAHDIRKVREILAAADVFTLPSVRTPTGDQDGVPVALMEAMATGLPVVTTRVSGIPDLVAHDACGLVVEPADVEALANALARLLKNPTLGERLGAHARTVVGERHDIRRSVERLQSMFLEAADAC